MDYTVHGILQVRILEWVVFPFSREFPNPGINSKLPILQVDSIPAEPQGKHRMMSTNIVIPLHLKYVCLHIYSLPNYIDQNSCVVLRGGELDIL